MRVKESGGEERRKARGAMHVDRMINSKCRVPPSIRIVHRDKYVHSSLLSVRSQCRSMLADL